MVVSSQVVKFQFEGKVGGWVGGVIDCFVYNLASLLNIIKQMSVA